MCLAAGMVLTACQSSRISGVPAGLPSGAAQAGDTIRINRVLTRLLVTVPPGACRQYRVVTSAVPNASMNPRGILTISTGLLQFAETDDLLAFAIAHELAHAVMGHPARLRRAGLFQLMAAAAVTWAAHEASHSKGEAALAGGGFLFSTAFLGTRPLTRRMEQQADYMARDLIRRAGYDPGAAVRFWEKYAAARPRPPLPDWLSSHPPDAVRIRYLSPSGHSP